MQQFFSRSPFVEQPLLDIYQGLLSRCDAQLTERIFETRSAAISKICPQIFEILYCEIHPGMIYWTKFTAAN